MHTVKDYRDNRDLMSKAEPAPGTVLVHNHVDHGPRTRSGTNGFRVWVQTSTEGLVGCDCGWRSDLGRHYRVASRNRQRSKETPTRAQACASRPTERPAPQSAEA